MLHVPLLLLRSADGMRGRATSEAALPRRTSAGFSDPYVVGLKPLHVVVMLSIILLGIRLS